MKEHIKKHGDEYLLSPAATLTLISEAIHSPDSGPEGKVRSKRVIDQVMSAARGAMFQQADILETMLASNAKPARLLPLFDALVECVGAWRVAQITQEALADARGGNA